MSYNLSGCVFIKDCFKGAFCLFESMYQLLPLCDEFIVMDLGSTDGTLEALREIEAHNPKVKVVQSSFYEKDAAIFAHLANDLIAVCENPHVLYFQADEIWHEQLVKLTHQALREGERDLSFWRVQLKYNFQDIKWFPHPVHRVGPKDRFEFENDGMNTTRAFEAKMVSEIGYIVRLGTEGEVLKKFKLYEYELAEKYISELKEELKSKAVVIKGKLWDIENFMQWGDTYKFNPITLPTNNMILDVSLTGGFIDNIPDRRRMHLPYWNEPDVMPADEGGLSVDNWYESQRDRQEWDLHSTKFNIPEIMRYHLGRRRYTLRGQLLEMLKVDEGWR